MTRQGIDSLLLERYDTLHGWLTRKAAKRGAGWAAALALARRLGKTKPPATEQKEPNRREPKRPDSRRVTAAACVAVSPCLLGIACRYDGGVKTHPAVVALLAEMNQQIVPVCTEVLAELGVPRLPMRFYGGDGAALLAESPGVDLKNSAGRSCARRMILGARRGVELVAAAGCRAALLKERSPSCGLHHVYCGRRLVKGRGVFAALLSAGGVACFSEQELDTFESHLITH